jgi:hypothetical protein
LANPDPGCHKRSTGQLRSLGNAVICDMLKITPEEYEQQKGRAGECGVGCLCLDEDSHEIGVSPAVSVISDSEVLTKHVILPSRQTKCHPPLVAHYTVSVFLVGAKDQNGDIQKVDKVMVAGWATGQELKRWIKQKGTPPFTTKNTALAIAPCDILKPMDLLLNKLVWDKETV